MKCIADIHIHSHFSRATSKLLSPEYIDLYAGMKGIKIVGTGDFTHAGWLSELKEKTKPDGNGFHKLKEEYKLESEIGDNQTRFLLTAEISNIYKRDGKVRKVHNLVLVSDFEAAEKINQRLINLGGNLSSDGRPILGLDSRDLLEIVLECNENNYFIPAHIWTPWFSMLGSKSGFDSIKQCYADLAPHIHTIETGLSTDPPMNWLCSFLDNVTLVSNSDAHSPDRLGRNANIFDIDLNYSSLTDALRTGNPIKHLGTIDMFPQEGKYHYDGHRKCNVCWNPLETLKNNTICPVCKKPVTIGVMNRVIQLSDRNDVTKRPNRLPFYSIIPLKEILAEIVGLGVKSKQVEQTYLQTIKKMGPEMDILLKLSVEDIEKKSTPALAEAIRRMRNREIIVQEGFDGEYGIINVFRPGEVKNFQATKTLFQVNKNTPPEKIAMINFDLSNKAKLLSGKKKMNNLVAEKQEKYLDQNYPKTFDNLNKEQFAAVQYIKGPLLIIAGPGTGKTKTLTSKISWIIGNHLAQPEEILAITFTNKAAGELKERLKVLLKNGKSVNHVAVYTFHAFGFEILKKYYKKFGRKKEFILADENLKLEIIKSITNKNFAEIKKISSEISKMKKGDLLVTSLFNAYENELQKLNAFDLDDLLEKPLHLFTNKLDIAKEYQKKFSHIFIDEYQDTNDIQYKLIRLLAPNTNSNLCAVGDANQSIYGFRGANASYISKFSIDYPEAKTFRLTKSYRCSQTILSASSNVLNQKSEFLEGLSEGVQIYISEQTSGAAEAEFIARQIVDLVGGVSFFSLDSSVTKGNSTEKISCLSEIAILCRTRNQFEAIVKALKDHLVPYQVIGTVPFFQMEPFQSFINVINAFLLNNYESATPIFKLKKIPISKLQFELAQTQLKDGIIPFLNFVKENHFASTTINPEQWNRFLHLSRSSNSVSEFIQFLKLGSAADALDKNMEAISVMTLHASKGLEFECVFIPGCEDGLLPYNLYKTEVDVEEEKRLLYVGMTRAKRLLYLSHAKKRIIRNQNFALKKSPFINSIQQELTQQIKNKTNKKPEENDNQLSLF